MDATNWTFSDLVGFVKSWIPWRSEPANVSRDFWMPDQSCRVCYECDLQFNLFNRRHHCRLCGRIFCAKCTSNWVPTLSSESTNPLEEWDKIRVCNYCYKQWEQGLAESLGNGLQVADLDLISTSPSASSFISTKSSETCDSSSMTFVSLPQSAALSPYQSALLDTTMERQSVAASVSSDHAMVFGEQNPSQDEFEFYPTRSDDEDEESGLSCLGSGTSHLSQVHGYFDHVHFDDAENDYESHNLHPDEDAVDSETMNISSSQNRFDSHDSLEVEQVAQRSAEHYISDEGEAPSSIYVAEDVNTEPVDFENNGVLWLPPEPEDAEDEKEVLLFEDDDDEEEEEEDSAGEWGYSRSSRGFGSGEYGNKDKPSEEQKRVLRNVLDGHFRALVAQLLQVENLPAGEENDKESWLEIVTALSWEAALLLKPDMSKSGQMDPGGYVKVKCLASGRRSESMVVRGVVCKKNVAHRRMTSKIESPRLLILGGALEYQRVSNALSSFDTLLQQEMDHLKMAVAKIDAHHPDILLVEKSVHDMHRKVFGEHGTAGQDGKKLVKTLMYFEGCPKPLGCTILLRGANGDELKKVKHVLQYGVFAAYHLALETSFLADEGATLPEIPLNTPITVALPGKRSKIERSISTIPGFTVPDSEKTPGPQPGDEPQRSNSVPASELVKVTNASIHGNEYAETSNIPTSMSSQFVEPPASSLNEPSLHASEELGLVGLAMSLEGKGIPADRLAATGDCRLTSDFGNSDVKIRQSDCSDVYAKRNVSKPQPLQLNGKQNFEDQYTLKEDFPPSPADHQSILVSLSSRCVWKGTVCERSHLFRIKYYGNFDKPLGRFLRDHLFDQNYRCRSCEMPAEAHVQCYTHRQGTLTISVKKLPEILLPGERDGKIWMWHRCLKCPRTNGFPPATRRVVMSDAAWGLSFGKFLELSFSNHAAASRVASCGHSLHRDCLRFYGFGKMVACFRYASIDVHSVHLPPPKLDFNHESQEWIEKEFNEVASRAELLFSEVLNALRLLVERNSSSSLLNGGVKVPESRHHLVDLEGMLQKEKSEFEESLQKVLNKEARKGQPTIDVLELNRLRRQLVFQSYMWDHRLIYADSLDNKSQQDDIENAKPDQSPEHGVSDRSRNHCPEVLHHRTDALFNSDLGNQNSIALKANDESDTMESNVTVPRVLSDGQVPISLSDTLDAAWTGENYPGVGITKNNNLSISVEADNLSTAGTSEKLDVEDNTEDLSVSKVSRSPSFLSSKSENMEDAVSWLGMSFMSFYRSLNKNFLGSSQKLDTLSEYNPVYISSFRESELKGGARLLLPVGVNDTVVPIYDDEPTSIISYALLLPDYLAQLSDEPERSKDTSDSLVSMQSLDAGHFQSFHSLDEMVLESYRSFGSVEDTMLPLTASRSSLSLDPLSYTKALHARVSFYG
ncbi:UNVERIFIED_CONTAM: 1-phosphatidylinositol-3-phosphate 5-kinase FAB1B [Sesamum calycinum]|uniref:Phosphatidylinositol 3-phosphate 5-kinase type III n=1 Tax=Sesamum calycinum TaxID=2727403 RepID=A0AAW2SXL3_9LAMI